MLPKPPNPPLPNLEGAFKGPSAVSEQLCFMWVFGLQVLLWLGPSLAQGCLAQGLCTVQLDLSREARPPSQVAEALLSVLPDPELMPIHLGTWGAGPGSSLNQRGCPLVCGNDGIFIFFLLLPSFFPPSSFLFLPLPATSLLSFLFFFK